MTEAAAAHSVPVQAMLRRPGSRSAAGHGCGGSAWCCPSRRRLGASVFTTGGGARALPCFRISSTAARPPDRAVRARTRNGGSDKRRCDRSHNASSQGACARDQQSSGRARREGGHGLPEAPSGSASPLARHDGAQLLRTHEPARLDRRVPHRALGVRLRVLVEGRRDDRLGKRIASNSERDGCGLAQEPATSRHPALPCLPVGRDRAELRPVYRTSGRVRLDSRLRDAPVAS
jgi:hypothetical protein